MLRFPVAAFLVGFDYRVHDKDTQMSTRSLDEKVCEIIDRTTTWELAVGYLRYEALRKLNVRQFAELDQKNIREGVHFDDLVDALIEGAK